MGPTTWLLVCIGAVIVGFVMNSRLADVPTRPGDEKRDDVLVGRIVIGGIANLLIIGGFFGGVLALVVGLRG
jgi:hypothetical protein